jgi:hypothetical protein
MKKFFKFRYCAVALSVILLLITVGVVAATTTKAGSSDDPFISLNYISGTYTPSVMDKMKDRAAEKTAPLLTQAESSLASGQGISSLKQGDTVKMNTGGTILLISGSAAVNAISGTLVDATDGTELKSASQLTQYHRYLAAENSEITVGITSATAQIAVHNDTSGASSLPFSDVNQSDWFYMYVQYAYEHQLFNGTSQTAFSPNGEMNRAMLATVLYRLDGSKETGLSNPFSDVSSEKWYTDGVTWAADKGIVEGISPSAFGPDRSVTREQIAVMLYRYMANYLEQSVSGSGDLTKFSDANKISSWAKAAVSWAVDTGILTGMGNGNLCPGSTASRAEVSALLQRFSTIIAK